MEMVESPSVKAFRQTSASMNICFCVLVRGLLEDLMRFFPAISSINVIDKIHSYVE